MRPTVTLVMLLASRTARCLVRVAPRSAARFAPLRRASTAEPAAPDAVDPSSLESAFLQEFVGRGYLAQCTDLSGLDEAMSGGSVAAYLGFDATADSLHVGSLLQIMILRLLQKHGHTPVVLVGGGTTKVGDPSGKDESRKLLDDDAIAANIAGISAIFDKFLDFGPGGAVLVNNADWLDELAYVKFLREFGSHFSVNRMLSFESVKQRPVWKSNLQPDFNVRVIKRFGPDSFAVLRELDESNRSVQKSAESTSNWPS